MRPFTNGEAKFGGMDASLMKRLKELEDENRRLKKMYAEERLIAEIRKDVRPSERKEMAKTAREKHGASIRLVCKALSISETCYRYQPRLSDENTEIADWLVRLTHNWKDWGFGLCFLFLRNVKGFKWNHK